MYIIFVARILFFLKKNIIEFCKNIIHIEDVWIIFFGLFLMSFIFPLQNSFTSSIVQYGNVLTSNFFYQFMSTSNRRCSMRLNIYLLISWSSGFICTTIPTIQKDMGIQVLFVEAYCTYVSTDNCQIFLAYTNRNAVIMLRTIIIIFHFHYFFKKRK